ncbi:MAG: adenylate/guanylate cyclase domain-containing protein [Flavobacteriales bacterium]|nr:adenylate/guanylate cyclase domain-containing protein [Flavobacteriales bacterium]
MTRSACALTLLLLYVGASGQQLRIDELRRPLKEHSAPDAARLQLLVEMARAYGLVQLDTAVLFADEANALAERLGDAKSAAHATAIRGTYEVLRGGLARGQADLNTALEASEQSGSLAGQVQSRIGFLVVRNLQGRTTDGDKEFESASALATALRDTTAMGTLLLIRAMWLCNGSLLEQAMVLLDRAIALGTAHSSHTSLSPAYSSRSYVHACMGELDASGRDIDSALHWATHTGDRIALSVARGNEGTLHWFRSNMPKALECYLESLRLSEQLGARPDMVNTEGNVGKAYSVMDDQVRALEYAERASNGARELGLHQCLLSSLCDLGNAALELKNQQKSSAAFKEMAFWADSLNNQDFLAEADVRMADSYLAFEMPDSALKYALRGTLGMRKLESTSDVGRALVTEGKALSAASDVALRREGIDPKDRSSRALRAYEEAITAVDGFFDEVTYASYLGISTIHERDGNFAEALIYHRKAVAVHDSMLTAERNQAMGELQIQYETEKKEQQIVLLGKDKEVQAKEIQKQKLVRNGFMGGFALVALFAGVFLFQRNRIGKEKKRSEELLLNILPAEVAEELKAKGEADAKQIDQVTVLFTDFKGFTAMSEKLSPKELVADIHECFSAFDHIMAKHGIEKIKTIGDAYMAAGGLPTPNTTHALDVVKAALDIRDFIAEGKARKVAAGLPYFEIRIGIHTGPVVAGIVGVKKFAYDIWGDTVNIASRMESSGEVGQVNISESTYALVKDEPGLMFTSRGKVQAKGKGEMEMYFVRQSSERA